MKIACRHLTYEDMQFCEGQFCVFFTQSKFYELENIKYKANVMHLLLKKKKLHSIRVMMKFPQ